MDSPPTDRTIETYNQIAGIYAEKWFPLLMAKELEDFSSCLRGRQVLDAGCGPGRDVNYFVALGLNAIGIDLSIGMLIEAKRRVPLASLLQMDMRKLAFANRSFEGIWASASLLHLTKTDARVVLDEFHRVLHGILFVSVKQGYGEEIVYDESYGGCPRFFSYYLVDEIESYVRKAGFAVEKVEQWVEKRGITWINVLGSNV